MSNINNELSAQFDVMYNNVTSNQAPGLNEYEKSVFLTKAQNMLLIEYFNNRTDGVGGGFDGSQKRQYDFSQLISTYTLKPLAKSKYATLDKRSVAYVFPKDYFLTVNEILADGSYQYNVIPLSYDEYSRIMMKPYNFPVKRAVWRLFTGEFEVKVGEYDENHEKYDLNNDGIIDSLDVQALYRYMESDDDSKTSKYDLNKDGEVNTQDVFLLLEYINASDASYTAPVAEIIGKPTMENGGPKSDLSGITYTLRYVKKPKPIILEDLINYGDNLSIEGETNATECELPVETHQELLERAVTLAKIAWQGGTATQAAAQQREDR